MNSVPSDFRLYKPVKPGTLNQAFGSNPADYAKFHDDFGNPLKGHDGLDFYAPHGTPVYAAHDGFIHYEKDAHGGEGMWLRDTGSYTNIPATPITCYWHLIGDTELAKYPSPIPLDGKEYPVKAGDLIGYADNTGAPYESSGDHLHFGLLSRDANFNIINHVNGFNGRIDPTPFFTSIFAQDVPKTISLYQKVIPLLQQLLGLKRSA